MENLGRDLQRALGDSDEPLIGPIYKNPLFPMFHSRYDTQFSAESFCIDYMATQPGGISMVAYNENAIENIEQFLQKKGVAAETFRMEDCGYWFVHVPESNPAKRFMKHFTRRESLVP